MAAPRLFVRFVLGLARITKLELDEGESNQARWVDPFDRDEAIRSRDMAEQRFLMHDLMGAKKFALKAQCLFPGLEGLPQFLAVLDVHITAEEKVGGGDRNWYAILQTDIAADDTMIKKQYRKLALLLHPDKNNAVGAEGAFKLITEAWSVLSDKGKKTVHDVRRGKSPRSANVFRNFTSFSASSWAQSKPAQKPQMFWFVCPSCKSRFQCPRVYEVNHILCTICEQQPQVHKTRKACVDPFSPPTSEPNTRAAHPEAVNVSSNKADNHGSAGSHEPGHRNKRSKASTYSKDNEAKTRAAYSEAVNVSPCTADNDHASGSASSAEARHHNQWSKASIEMKDKVNTPGDEPQHRRGHTNTSWHYQQHPDIAFSSSKVPSTHTHFPSNLQFHWGSHKSKTGSSSSVAANAKATADMVTSVYRTVRRERVRVQNEARQKSTKERIEREREARRQERKERHEQKQRRKEEELKKQANAAHHAKKAFDRLFGRDQKPSKEEIQ